MFQYIVFILLLPNTICLNTSSELYKSISIQNNKTFNQALFAYEMINKIYNSFNQWYFTFTYCNFTYFENRILKYVQNYGYGYSVILVNGCPNRTTKEKPRFDKHGLTAYLVTSNSLELTESEVVITALKNTGIYQPRSTVIFVISTLITLDAYNLYKIKVHFRLLWSRMITNSVLILWYGKLKMYSYNPFLDELKDVTHVKDVSHGLAQQYKNLYGHEIRLSVYRTVYMTNETGQIHCRSEIVKTVIKALNATCKPVAPRDGSTVGNLLDNGTATGVTADLMDGYTDFELHSRILKKSYYGYIDTTYPLDNDELCFIIQNSKRLPTFLATFQLISNKILFAFIFILIFVIVIAILFRKCERNIMNINDKQSTGSIIMDLLKCFLKQTVNINYLGLVFRCITLSVIVYALIINCAIDGVITSAITYPRFRRNLNTVEVYTETNLTLGIHNRDYDIYKNSLDLKVYNLIKDRIELFTDKKIKEFIDKRQYQYATLLRKAKANNIVNIRQNRENRRPLFYIIPDCPVPCFLVYGLRLGSPYIHVLNNIIGYLNQAGVIQHWSKTEKYTLYEKLLSHEDKIQKPLTIIQLKEVFIAFVVGLHISTTAFALEIIVHKITRPTP